MARSYAAVHHRIWADPAWRSLDVEAQHLYLLLISQPQMNLAGVLPLQLRRWSMCVAGWSPDDVARALGRLCDARFVLADEDTEEVLIRSLIRNDGAYRMPGSLKSILQHAEGTQGPSLRRELAIELGRLDPLVGKTAAEGMALIAATRLVLMADGTPPDGGVIHRSDGIEDGMPDGIGDPLVGTHRGSHPGDTKDPIGDPTGSGSGSGALLSLVDFKGGKSAPPPPDEPELCARHEGMDRDGIPPCRACGRLRENWELSRTEAAKPRPLPPLCGECENRWIETPDGLTKCPRCHPAEVRTA